MMHHPVFPKAGTLKPDNAAHTARLASRGWVELPEPPPSPPEPITEVETYALDEALDDAGLRNAVTLAIQGLPAKERRNAENRWLKKKTMRRNEPLMLALIQGLQWTPAQADALFVAAHAIQNS